MSTILRFQPHPKNQVQRFWALETCLNPLVRSLDVVVVVARHRFSLPMAYFPRYFDTRWRGREICDRKFLPLPAAAVVFWQLCLATGHISEQGSTFILTSFSRKKTLPRILKSNAKKSVWAPFTRMTAASTRFLFSSRSAKQAEQ